MISQGGEQSSTTAPPGEGMALRQERHIEGQFYISSMLLTWFAPRESEGLGEASDFRWLGHDSGLWT
jgi:hypothetical protein